MRWTERQLAMLREMGVRVWARDGGSAAGDETADIALVDAAPALPLRRDVPSTAANAPIAPATSLQARERDDADRLPPSADRSGERPMPSRTSSPHGTAPLVAAGPVVETPLGPADWLIVVEAASVGAAQADLGATGRAQPCAAAMSADEERLLAAMLRAVRVSFDAPTRAGRAARVGVDAGLRGRIAGVLETVRPQVVLALGRAAAEALVGADEPLGRLRGRAHALGDVAVIVTFAPSYLLRHPAEKAKAWADLCLAVRASEAARAKS